jgi:general stress protein 26
MARRFRRLNCSIVIATLAILAILATGSDAMSQATQRDIDAFAKSTLVYIATVRKDGNQSKSTPVWFTTTPDHILLIETGPQSWKARRIRRGSPVMIWIGAVDGPAFVGKAEITTDSAVETRIITDYPEKYLMARMGFAKPTQEKFEKGQIIALKITPVRDLPEHFANRPATPAPSLEPAASASTTPH